LDQYTFDVNCGNNGGNNSSNATDVNTFEGTVDSAKLPCRYISVRRIAYASCSVTQLASRSSIGYNSLTANSSTPVTSIGVFSIK